jgi:hypothetical protein
MLRSCWLWRHSFSYMATYLTENLSTFNPRLAWHRNRATAQSIMREWPNKSARFKVRAIVVLLGWRHWKFNICHLSFLQLVVMECYRTCYFCENILQIWESYGKISWSCYLMHWRSELATKVVRFDPMRLLSMGVCEISCLCEQTTNNSWAQGGDSTYHWRNWAAVMQMCHWEFRQKSKSVPAESWGTFVGFCVPQLMAVCVLYTEIKISALFE